MRIFSLEDAFIDCDKLVGNCFGQIEQIELNTITSAADIATGECLEIAELISRVLLRSSDQKGSSN
jgi:hypothetical protein